MAVNGVECQKGYVGKGKDLKCLFCNYSQVDLIIFNLVSKLLIGFQSVVFLPSVTSFFTPFLNSCGRD